MSKAKGAHPAHLDRHREAHLLLLLLALGHAQRHVRHRGAAAAATAQPGEQVEAREGGAALAEAHLLDVPAREVHARDTGETQARYRRGACR